MENDTAEAGLLLYTSDRSRKKGRGACVEAFDGDWGWALVSQAQKNIAACCFMTKLARCACFGTFKVNESFARA